MSDCGVLVVRALGCAAYDPSTTRAYELSLAAGLTASPAIEPNARALACGRAAAQAYFLGRAFGSDAVALPDYLDVQVRLGLSADTLNDYERALLDGVDLVELADFVLPGALLLARRALDNQDVIDRIAQAVADGLTFHFTATDVASFLVHNVAPMIRLSEPQVT